MQRGVLWIDFQSQQPAHELREALASLCKVFRSRPDVQLFYGKGAPSLIIIEADNPDEALLKQFLTLKQRFPRTVITSYSIHYTKLYEPPAQPRPDCSSRH